MPKSILLGCLALALVAWVRPAVSGTLDANTIHETVFPSGLRLVVREAHGADLATVQVWIKAGGYLEDQTTSGYAHVIEHLVFKGTQRRGPGAIDDEIESLGGELTATTEKDWTMYGTTVASQHALHVIDVLGDALRHPRFQASDFQAEKPLILEEVAEGRAEPEHVVTDVLFRQAFQHHPYSRDARGSPTVINHLNLDSLKAYFEKYYTAPNTTVVVVGDVQPAAVERQVRTAFGAEAPAANKPPLKLPEPEAACQSPRRQVIETPFDTAFIGLAFPAPAVTADPAVYATDILVTMLEHVPYGRLPAALRGKVGGVKATFETRRQPGLLTIIAQTKPGDLEAVDKTLRAEVQRLTDQPPTAQEIDFTRRQLVGSFVGDNETFSGQAGSLGFYAAIDRWQFATTYLDNVRKVTPEQLQATIKKYLSLDHCCTVVLQPRQPGSRPAPPTITTLRRRALGVGGAPAARPQALGGGGASGFGPSTIRSQPSGGRLSMPGAPSPNAWARAAGAPPTPNACHPHAQRLSPRSGRPPNALSLKAQSAGRVGAEVGHLLPRPNALSLKAQRPTLNAQAVRRVTLANGLKILCKANNASEIVAIVCQVRAGLPEEPEDRGGLAGMTAEAMLRGTTSRDRQALGQAIVAAGGDVRAQPGFDFTEVSAVTDRARWESAAKLLADILAHPSFEADQLEDVRNTVKRRGAGFEDDFTGGSYQEMMGQLYQDGPYGRPIFGTDASLARVTLPDIRKFWKDNYAPDRMTIAIVGDVDASSAVRAAERAFENLPARTAASPKPIAPDHLDRTRVDLIQKQGSVGQVMAGCLAPPVTASNYPVMSVLEAALGGGKRSRIGARIRDQHGVGYASGSTYQPLLGQSHLIAFLMFPVPPADRAAPVLEQPKHLLVQQLEELATTGPTDAEVARARAFAIGEHALRHERNRDQAKWISWSEAAGLGVSMDQDFASRVAAVTKEQVHEAAKQLFKNYALVITLPPPG